MHTLNETVELITNLGVKKVHKTLKEQLVLSFIAGAMISFGYMAYVKSVALLGSSVGVLVGAAIFPIGLIVILVAGGELITGNMMVVGTAYWSGKVKGLEVLKNWLVITCGNILGALCVAILFSAFLESVPKDLMLDLVHHKLSASPLQLIVSGIGCNWFVGLAVWLFVALKDGSSKLIGIWFPVAVFVVLGFQHSVANIYLLGFGLYHNAITFGDFLYNFSFVYLGNIVGGAIFVGFLYTYVSDFFKSK